MTVLSPPATAPMLPLTRRCSSIAVWCHSDDTQCPLQRRLSKDAEQSRGCGRQVCDIRPCRGDMPDSFAMPCKLIGGDGIVRCAERQMCSLACRPALPGTHAARIVTARRTTARYSMPNNKSTMAMTAKVVTHSSWSTILHPSFCYVHSSKRKCRGRKHGKQFLREHMRRLQMVPQSLTFTQSPHGSPLWA